MTTPSFLPSTRPAAGVSVARRAVRARSPLQQQPCPANVSAALGESADLPGFFALVVSEQLLLSEKDASIMAQNDIAGSEVLDASNAGPRGLLTERDLAIDAMREGNQEGQ